MSELNNLKNKQPILNNPYLVSDKIELRDYQTNIVRKCINKNSLVVLPTGLGKTLIALLIVAESLLLYPPESKVIILAPTRPLIDQHYKSFLKFLAISEQKYGVLTGRVHYEERIHTFERCQLLFYTPQTLRNDLVKRRYTLEKVCLIIFDEAHHAIGDYPYPLIADEYHDQNPDGNILGLTASPGFSKAKITELCKNLHIPTVNIHIRTREDKDVKDFVKPIEFLKVGVELTPLMKDIYKILKYCIEERLKYLSETKLLEHQGERIFDKIFRKDLLKLNIQLLDGLRSSDAKSSLYTAISINAQALILYHMAELIEQQGLDILLIYLEKINKEAKRTNSSKAMKVLASDTRLRHIYLELKKREHMNPMDLFHPKIGILVKIIVEELTKTMNPRILVFVKLRDSVKSIVDKLKSNPHIKPIRFVGQYTKSSDDKGLSQKDQITILNKFREGEYNVLVSTNVGEEGLDIAECDLVIFYDVVASEIRLIQRKGRTARQREGKAIILYCKDTHDEIYLNIALNRLNKMNKNLRQTHTDSNRLKSDKTSGYKIIKSPASPIKPEKKVIQNTLFMYANNHHHPLPPKKAEIVNSSIILSAQTPMKFGLRKKLDTENISYQIRNIPFHILLFDKILIQIFNFNNSLEVLQKQIKEFNEENRTHYKLLLVILDLINTTSLGDLNGEIIIVKKRLLDFAAKNHITLVIIDHPEELFFITKSILKKNLLIE